MVASIRCRFFRNRLKGDYPLLNYWTLEMMDGPTLDAKMFPAALIPWDLGELRFKERHRSEGFLGHGLIKPLELIICYHRPDMSCAQFVALIRQAFLSSQARGVRISDYRNAVMLLAERGHMRPLGSLFPTEPGTALH